jgi:type IX secretion system PorP/SprF family membrane protein
MRIFGIVLVFLLTVALQRVAAQNDPLYNQYQFNQLLINPAYTGINDRLSAMWLTRLQWLGVPGAPTTNTASVHTSFKTTKMGLGLIIMNDRLGVNNNTEINATYSYRLDFGKSRLQFGLQGGMINLNYDYSKLNLEYMDDPNLNTQQAKFTRPNIGTGLFYAAPSFFLGFSVPRLVDIKANDGMIGSVRYRRSEYLSAGYIIHVSDQIVLKPSVLVKATEGAPVSYDININALFAKVLWAGLTLRSKSAIGLNTQLQINDRIRFGYTYEYPFNPTAFGNYGTHELMVQVDFAVFSNQLLTQKYY